MPIGRMSGGKRTYHPRYRTSRRRSLSPQVLRVSPATGFVQLQAQAVYDADENRLVVTVTGKRAPKNLGPGIFEHSVVEDWHRPQNEDGSATQVLKEVLESYAARLTGHAYPEKMLYLERCLPTGRDMLQFTERACSVCICWYCELSDP